MPKQFTNAWIIVLVAISLAADGISMGAEVKLVFASFLRETNTDISLSIR